MNELIEIDGIWFMRENGKEVPLDPQPHFGKMRWDGFKWEVHMGYPHGHDVPHFNGHGFWTGKDYDEWCETQFGDYWGRVI